MLESLYIHASTFPARFGDQRHRTCPGLLEALTSITWKHEFGENEHGYLMPIAKLWKFFLSRWWLRMDQIVKEINANPDTRGKVKFVIQEGYVCLAVMYRTVIGYFQDVSKAPILSFWEVRGG
jgi:hypothetical protein